MVRWLFFFIVLMMSGLVQAKTILVLGDSISAAYGLEKVEQGWVALMAERLKPRGITVVNASISGETSAGGLARVDALLQRHQPALVILELGANDGLRGLSTRQLETNLADIIVRVQARGAKPLLLGMKLPPNYGKRYADLFQNVYAVLAERYRVALVPFLLQGVGGQAAYLQADGIHPNQAAQAILLEQVWNPLEGLLKP